MSSGTTTTRLYHRHSLARQRTFSGSEASSEPPSPNMSDTALRGPKSKSHPDAGNLEFTGPPILGDAGYQGDVLSDYPRTESVSSTPPLSRSHSFSNSTAYDDDRNLFPPLERLTVFDFIENLALPQRLEKLQTSISTHTEKVKRHQQLLKSTGISAKDKVIDEWRRRLPTQEEQLERYKKRMRENVDRLNKRWNDSRAVTLREKVSFICGVLNIFISGYLVGARPEWFHIWYTLQLLYFMPIRFYTYRKKEFHYFLADLCYFVNFLLVLSLWVFPNSKRLFISVYCLAYGNNAVAIAMWRNSLVFHSLDKVTSLFIHIMPCVTLHCVVHLVPDLFREQRFPAIHTIIHSDPSSSVHYNLWDMMLWATVPYAIWQLSYHFLITVRRREKIKAGRPTSFTWLRRSYAPTLLGKFVLSLPDSLQEPAFMMIQYVYALLTMTPCPLWFWYRWASGGFLCTVFVWSVYNGATYYIDVFGTRFQKELEALKRDVAKWQNSPELAGLLDTPGVTSKLDSRKGSVDGFFQGANDSNADATGSNAQKFNLGADGPIQGLASAKSDIEHIPLLNDHEKDFATGADAVKGDVRPRK